MDQTQTFDAIVIGGGPAGLVAAIYLARFRRSVLIVDADRSRLAKVPRSHNYPGFPNGIVGAALLSDLRAQSESYRVEASVGEVRALERRGDEFEVRWQNRQATARCVLLATGAVDIEPSMPYVAEALREGALRYCPVCDGFEVIDRDIGVIANGPSGVREALYLRHYSDRLTLFMEQGESALSPGDRERLRSAGIGWTQAPVTGVRAWDRRVTVSHGDTATSCDTVYCALGMQVRSDLARDLGAEVDANGYLSVDRHQRTNVPGLYAAGDVASGLNQISVAAGGATIAASAIHLALSAGH